MQKRTDDAPYAAGKLGVFGGAVEDGETYRQCVEREIEEETSLKVSELEIEEYKDVFMPSNDYFDRDRCFHLYKVPISNINFELYEGEKVEADTIENIMKRDDLADSATYIFDTIF